MRGGISEMAKQELLATVRDRYRASSKREKSRILDEFIAVTGHHRKHERPLPCSYAPGPDDWPVRETVELVLNVMSPLGVDGE